MLIFHFFVKNEKININIYNLYIITYMFCPVCENIIDISKTTNKTTLSYSDEQLNALITSLLNNSNTSVLNSEICHQIINSTPFNKLNKQSQKQLQTILNPYIDADIISNAAYYKCSNCGYNKIIPPETLITTIKPPSFILNSKLIDNLNHSLLDPYTTNYICPNKSCESHSHKILKPAKFTKNKNLVIVYVCPYCNSYWKN